MTSSRAVTLRDVARSLGVSHSTVSRALRNNPEIPAAHRAKIQAEAIRLGYRVNPSAALLSQLRQTSRAIPIGAVIGWLNFWPNPKNLRAHGEFDRYWQGASATAAKFGYRLEEFHGAGEVSMERMANILTARGINALLLPPATRLKPDFARFPWERFSVIQFGRSISSLNFQVVAADQMANTLLAVEKTLAHGYRRIGWVEWAKPWEFGRMFKAGFLLARSRAPRGKLLAPLSLHVQEAQAQKTLERWMEKERPDVLLTDMAEIPEMLARSGLRVGKDIGLVANSVLDGKADAGIDQNSYEIGRVAVLSLISLLHDNDRGRPALHRESLIKGHWVDGASLPPR